MTNYKKLKYRLPHIKHYFLYDIWYEATDTYPRWKQGLIHTYKTIAVSIKKFFKDECIDQSSALSFYAMLAVVPIFAIAFGIAGGFGLQENLHESISKSPTFQNVFWESIFGFSNSMLANTNSGIIAGIGFLFLLWVIMSVLSSIEKSLNDIWEIKKNRTFIRKSTDYISLILLTPILIAVTFSAKGYLDSNIGKIDIGFMQACLRYFLSFTPYLAAFLIFTLLYLILPNRRVPILPALISGIVAGSLFIIAQYLYVEFQHYMTSYNIVYGSFAALPLFMLWLRISWLIILYGAELGFSIEKKDHYIFENDYKLISDRRRKLYALMMTNLILHRFIERKSAYTILEISQIMRVPTPFLYNIANELTEMKIINRIYTSDRSYAYDVVFQPAFDIQTLSFFDIIHALDMHHLNKEFTPEEQPNLKYWAENLQKLDELTRNSELNVLLKNIKIN